MHTVHGFGGNIEQLDRVLGPHCHVTPLPSTEGIPSPHMQIPCACLDTDSVFSRGDAGWGAESPGLASQQGGAGGFC